MNFKTFVATIRLYWKTFVAAVAIVFAICVAWILLGHDKYVSNAQLMVTLNGSTTAEAYENDSIIGGRISTYITLLNSDVVSQHVIDKLGLKTSAPELSADINATNVPPKTAIIDVAVTDDSPQQAQRIAQTVADEFVNYTNSLETPTGEGAQKVVTTVVTAASEPHRRILVPILLGLVSAVFALLCGAIAVWLRSAVDPVVRNGYRAGLAAKVPVLAEVSAENPSSADFLNKFREVRHKLRSGATAAGPVVELTSVDAEEDNRVDTREIAYGLAQAMTIGGKRSVVIDSDGADPAGEIVAGEDGLPDTLSVTEVSGGLIAPLREEYESIIVASGPVLSTATPATVSDCADAVVLLVAVGKTKRRDVEQARTQLSAWGAPLTGVILVS